MTAETAANFAPNGIAGAPASSQRGIGLDAHWVL
jgi:hypothetical protein